MDAATSPIVFRTVIAIRRILIIIHVVDIAFVENFVAVTTSGVVHIIAGLAQGCNRITGVISSDARTAVLADLCFLHHTVCADQ